MDWAVLAWFFVTALSLNFMYWLEAGDFGCWQGVVVAAWAEYIS